MAGRDAALVGLSELEDLVVGVLAVTGESSRPHILVDLLLVDVVDAAGGGRRGGAPPADLSIDESVEGVAGETVEGGRDVAIGVEGIILGEVAGSGRGNSGESGEGKGSHG